MYGQYFIDNGRRIYNRFVKCISLVLRRVYERKNSVGIDNNNLRGNVLMCTKLHRKS